MSNTFYQWVPSQEFVSISLETINAGQTLTRQSGTAINSFERINHSGFIPALNTNAGFSVGQSVRYMSPYYAGGLIWNQSYSTQVASDGTTFVDPGYLSGVTPRISRQFQYSKGSIVGNTNVFNSSGQAGDFAGRNFSLSLTRNPYGGQTYANNIGDQLFNRFTVPFLIDPYGSEWRGVLRTGVASSGGETLLGVSYLDTHPHYDAASVAGEGSVTYLPPAYDVTYSVMRVFLALRGSNTPLWIMYDHWLDLIVAYNTGFNAEFPSGFSDEIGKHYSLSPPSKGWKGTGVYTAGSWAARNDAYIYGVPTSAQEGLEMDAYGIQSTAINTAVPEFTYSTAAELSADNAITLFTDKLTTSTKTYDEIDEVEFEASIDSDKVTVGTVSLDQASTTAQKINASISTDVPTPDFNLTGFQNYHAYNYSPALNVDNFFDSPVSKFSNKQISANHVEYIVDGFHTEENVLNSSPNDPHGDVKRVGKFNGKYIFERQSGHASPNDPHGLVVRYVRPVTDESPNSNPHQSPRFVLEIVNKGNNTGGFRLFDDKNHDSPLQTFEVDTVGDGDLVVGQKLSNSFANTGKIQPRFIGFPAKVGFYDENTLLIEQNPDGSDDKVLLNSNTGTKQTTTGTENVFLKPGKVYYTNKPSSISLRSFNHQDSPNGSVPSGRFPLQGFVQPFTSGGKKFTGMSVADKKVQHYFVYALDSTRVDFFDNVKSSAAPTESVFLEAGKSHTFVSTRSENKEGFIGGDSTGPSVGYIRTSGGNVLVSVASMEKEDSPNSSLDYSPKNQIEESSILTPTDTTSYVRRVSSTSSDSPSQIIGVDESLNFAVDSPHRTSESNQSPNFLRITNFSLRDDSSADMSPATSAKTDLNISVISSSLTIGDHSPSITPDDPSGQFNSPTSHVFLTDFLNDPKQVDINSDLIGVPNKTYGGADEGAETHNGITINNVRGGSIVVKDNTFRIIADVDAGDPIDFSELRFNNVMEIGAEYELSYIVDDHNDFPGNGRIVTTSHNRTTGSSTIRLADADTPKGVRIFKTFQAGSVNLGFTRGGDGTNDCTFSAVQLRKMKGNQEQKLSLNAGIAQKSMADTYVYGAPCTDYCIITPYDNTVTVKYKLQRLIKQNDSPAQLNGYQLAGFTTSDSPNVTINGFYTQSSKDTWVNNSDKRVKIVKKMPGTKYDSPSSDGKIEGLNSPEGGTQWCIIRSKGLQSEISEHQVYFEDPDMISQTNDFADIKWRQSLDKVFGFRGTTTVGQVYLAESASIEDRIKIKFDEFTYKTHSLQASLNSPNGVQVYGQGVDGSPELGGRDPIRVTDSPNDINRVAPTLWKFTGRRPFGLMINTQREIQTLSGFNTNSYNVTEVDNFATTNRQSDAKGRPSDLFKLQDLNYYSEYSYEIRSKLDISEWGDSFQQFAHPAGLQFFGRVQASPNNYPI